MSAQATKSRALPKTYEAALEELERLLAELESGALPLDQLLGSYQRGAELLAFCQDKLQAVQQQITILDTGAASHAATDTPP